MEDEAGGTLPPRTRSRSHSRSASFHSDGGGDPEIATLATELNSMPLIKASLDKHTFQHWLESGHCTPATQTAITTFSSKMKVLFRGEAHQGEYLTALRTLPELDELITFLTENPDITAYIQTNLSKLEMPNAEWQRYCEEARAEGFSNRLPAVSVGKPLVFGK